MKLAGGGEWKGEIFCWWKARAKHVVRKILSWLSRSCQILPI
jgi:hypothetical protein